MVKTILVAGLAGSVVFGAVWTAQAQESATPQVSTPDQQAQAAQPVQSAPSAPSCSNPLGCLLSGRGFSQPSPPVASPVPQPAADARPESGPPTTAQVADDAVPPVKLKPRAKPIHPVTIAAHADEVGRLKGLVATMPKGKIRIVRTDGAEADFSVTTALDRHDGDERAKLFTEQMHIVAGGTIRSVEDLKDKVVSFGPGKSAGQMAARKAFEALNIPVKETPLDLDNALDGLATGDVAAVVVLAPQPVERFAKLAAPGLHLVSWPQDGALPAGAVASTIDAARYPGLAKPDETIRAVGVDAILTISAKGARQPACKTFLAALAQHSAALSKHGFDLLKADLDSRNRRRFASDEQR